MRLIIMIRKLFRSRTQSGALLQTLYESLFSVHAESREEDKKTSRQLRFKFLPLTGCGERPLSFIFIGHIIFSLSTELCFNTVQRCLVEEGKCVYAETFKHREIKLYYGRVSLSGI